MKPATQAPSGAQVIAPDLVFANAVWHAKQARHWRRMKATPGGAGHAGRCEAHARRHERRVIEIAQQCEASLAKRTGHAGAAA